MLRRSETSSTIAPSRGFDPDLAALSVVSLTDRYLRYPTTSKELRRQRPEILLVVVYCLQFESRQQ